MPKQRTKLEKPLPVAEILKQAAGVRIPGIHPELARIWTVWDAVVGENVAKNAQPESVRGDLLVVSVTAACWAQQLQFSKQQMLSALNGVLGADVVKDIRFRVGLVRKEER